MEDVVQYNCKDIKLNFVEVFLQYDEEDIVLYFVEDLVQYKEEVYISNNDGG